MNQYPINIRRYEGTVNAYLAQPVVKDGILLYGSSFFTNWKNAAAQVFAASEGEMTVVNHGFGGATADELLYYYHKLVLPYEPHAMVTRMGPNDIFCGFTVEQAWQSAMRLCEFARADFPGIRIVLFSAFEHPSAKGWKGEKYAEFNALQREYAEMTENVDFVDISEFFYESPENVGTYEGFRDIFVEDGLHLKPEQYEDVAAYFVKKMRGLGIK